MKKVLMSLLITFGLVGWLCAEQTFYVFSNTTVAASATATSGIMFVSDTGGNLTLKGTITSATPDHSITFYVYRAAKYPDNDDIFTLSTADTTINSTACTGTTFSYPVVISHSQYIVIKATNGAGKETATIKANLVAGR